MNETDEVADERSSRWSGQRTWDLSHDLAAADRSKKQVNAGDSAVVST